MAVKKGRRLILLGTLVFVVYFFVASIPTEEALSLAPGWRSSLSVGTGAAGTTDTRLYPFSIAGRFGYYRADGELLLLGDDDGTVELSDEAWTSKGSDGVSTVRAPDGEVLYSFTGEGLPFFLEGRAYLVSPQQNALTAFDRNGAALWTRAFSAPITCVDARAALVAVGLLDGSLELLGAETGTKRFSFAPGGSKYPVIVGIRLSDSGRRIATVSGIGPQRFLLLEESNGTYKVIHHEYLESAFRRPVLMAFLEDDRYVAFEARDGIAVHDTSSGGTARIPQAGRLLSIANDQRDGKLFALFEEEEGRLLLGVTLPSSVFFKARTEETMPNKDGFLQRIGDRLIVGSPSAIAALDILRR